jgi:hypothetical protein
VDGRQASPLLELVTKVETGFATVAGAAAVDEAEDDAVFPAEAVDGAVAAGFEAAGVEAAGVEAAGVEATGFEAAGVEAAGVEAAAVELLGAVEPAAELTVADVVLAELSEPQPPRAAKKETHTNPEHTLSAPNLKIIVTCPIAA